MHKSIIVFYVLIYFVSQTGALNIEDCINAEIFCYHCDSNNDGHHCGNPFEYSHYYISKEYYMTACYGCCVKIIHSTLNGEQRILRSCTENLPFFNVTLKDDDAGCDVPDNRNGHTHQRHVCICENSFCNTAALYRGKSYLSILISCIVYLIAK